MRFFDTLRLLAFTKISKFTLTWDVKSAKEVQKEKQKRDTPWEINGFDFPSCFCPFLLFFSSFLHSSFLIDKFDRRNPLTCTLSLPRAPNIVCCVRYVSLPLWVWGHFVRYVDMEAILAASIHGFKRIVCARVAADVLASWEQEGRWRCEKPEWLPLLLIIQLFIILKNKGIKCPCDNSRLIVWFERRRIRMGFYVILWTIMKPILFPLYSPNSLGSQEEERRSAFWSDWHSCSE